VRHEEYAGFYDVVRVPLSDDGERVTNIFAVISYRQHDMALADLFELLRTSEAAI